MAAGLELFGTLGYARTPIRAVCAAASLNSRYFYESFTSREDLLYCVYQRIIGDIFARASEAAAAQTTIEAQARAGLRAGWTAVTEDRRKARIVAIETVGVSDRLERLRRDTRHALAQLTAGRALTLAGGLRLRLDPVITTRFLIGGVVGTPRRLGQRGPGRLGRRDRRALHGAVRRGGLRRNSGHPARPRWQLGRADDDSGGPGRGRSARSR